MVFFLCLYFKINIKIKNCYIASVTELAYTIAAVKHIDSFSIFQSLKNKNKCSSMECRSTAGIMILSLI